MTEEDYKNIADMIKERLTITTGIDKDYEGDSIYLRVINTLQFDGYTISESEDYTSVK